MNKLVHFSILNLVALALMQSLGFCQSLKEDAIKLVDNYIALGGALPQNEDFIAEFRKYESVLSEVLLHELGQRNSVHEIVTISAIALGATDKETARMIIRLAISKLPDDYDSSLTPTLHLARHLAAVAEEEDRPLFEKWASRRDYASLRDLAGRAIDDLDRKKNPQPEAESSNHNQEQIPIVDGGTSSESVPSRLKSVVALIFVTVVFLSLSIGLWFWMRKKRSRPRM